MSKIWVTSDWHFGHQKDFIYAPRGFNSAEEMSEEIIKRHNEVVAPDDIVYFLGDAMLNDNECGCRCIEQLNGKIHMIRGNHDTNSRIELYKNLSNVTSAGNVAEIIKYKGYNFYLSHYPTLTSNHDEEKPLKTKVINLCGHAHVPHYLADIDKGLIFHVEMDAHDCYPWDLDEIIEIFKNRVAH